MNIQSLLNPVVGTDGYLATIAGGATGKFELSSILRLALKVSIYSLDALGALQVKEVTRIFIITNSSEVIAKSRLINYLFITTHSLELELPSYITNEILIESFCAFFNGGTSSIKHFYQNILIEEVLNAYIQADFLASEHFDKALFVVIINRFSYLNFPIFSKFVKSHKSNPRTNNLIYLLTQYAFNWIFEFKLYADSKESLNDNAIGLFDFLNFVVQDQEILSRLDKAFGFDVCLSCCHIGNHDSLMSFMDMIRPLTRSVVLGFDDSNSAKDFFNKYEKIQTRTFTNSIPFFKFSCRFIG